ncbi:MAG: hypothetical protein JOZ42_12290 [Acetobacteraceae bacterium]|nr:hypothetical protein [Acetobacteraceae bacterium]
MTPSLRPLAYTWAGLLIGGAAGAGALQVMGPPPPRIQAVRPPAPPGPLAAQLKAAVPKTPPAPPAAAPPGREAALGPAPPADTAALSPPVIDPEPGLSPSLPAVADRSAGPAPQAAELTAPPRKPVAERRRAAVGAPAKPASPEDVAGSGPRFVGIFVTQADGTRLFKALP